VAQIKSFGPLIITGENAWRLRSRDGIANMYQVEHDEMYCRSGGASRSMTVCDGAQHAGGDHGTHGGFTPARRSPGSRR
jgi:hypothetical protein